MVEMLISQVVLVGKGKNYLEGHEFSCRFFLGGPGVRFFVGGKIPKKTTFSGSYPPTAPVLAG